MDPSVLASIPPGVDPADYLTQLRKQRVADFLTQDSLAPIQQQQPQAPVKGFYQQARISPLTPVAKLAEALLARKSLDQSNQGMAQMYAKSLQTFMDPQGMQGPAPVSAPMQSSNGTPILSGYGGGAGASDAQQPSASSAQQSPVNPMNPLHQPAAPLMRLYMSDPGKYLEAIKGTPEWQTAMAAYGGNQQGAMTALQAKYAKEGTIENRSGGENWVPVAKNADGTIKYQSVRTPNLSPDMDYSRGPDGNILEAHNLPGAVPSLAEQQGAKTGATFANTGHEVPMGGGVTRFMYGQDALGMPPALRGPQAPSAPQLQSVGPPKQYFPPSPAPSAPPTSSGPQPVPQRAGDGTTFDNNLWNGIPKMQIPVTPGQSSNAYQQEIVKSAATKHQQLVDEYGKQSAAGVQQLEYLTSAEKALPKAETGPMSEWLTEHRGKLIEMAPSLAPILGGTGSVTPTLELNKQLTNAALQGARSTFGSRMTQNEVKLQTEEMSPSVGMTHDALTSLIHQAKMKAAYAIQQDKDYGEYHSKNGDPNRFESQYNVRRPITRFSAQYDTPAAALDRLKQRPDTLPDFKAKFGWDPTQ